MAAHRRSVHAELAPTEALFLWADLNRVQDWWPGVTRASDVEMAEGYRPLAVAGGLPLAIAPGTRFTLWFGSRPVRHEVLWLDDRGQTAYRTRLDGQFRRGETIVTFDPESGGSLVTLVVRPEGLVPGMVAWLLAIGWVPGSFRSQLRAFGLLADRERWKHMTL